MIVMQKRAWYHSQPKLLSTDIRRNCFIQYALCCSLSSTLPSPPEQGIFIIHMKVMWKRDYGTAEVPISVKEAEVLNIHCPATCTIILMTVAVALWLGSVYTHSTQQWPMMESAETMNETDCISKKQEQIKKKIKKYWKIRDKRAKVKVAHNQVGCGMEEPTASTWHPSEGSCEFS